MYDTVVAGSKELQNQQNTLQETDSKYHDNRYFSTSTTHEVQTYKEELKQINNSTHDQKGSSTIAQTLQTGIEAGKDMDKFTEQQTYFQKQLTKREVRNTIDDNKTHVTEEQLLEKHLSHTGQNKLATKHSTANVRLPREDGQ
jgi:hypothetical protein